MKREVKLQKVEDNKTEAQKFAEEKAETAESLTPARRIEFIEKIQACFRRADTSRGASEAEAKTAIEMAKKMMARLNLSMAEIEEPAAAADALGKIVEEGGLDHFADPAHYELELTLVCKYLFNVTPTRTNKFDKVSGKMRRMLVFIGYETDVAMAREVYNTLRADVHEMCGDVCANEGNTERLHYKRGVVHGLVATAQKIHNDNEMTKAQQEKCTALVVVKTHAVDEYMKKNNPNTTTYKAHTKQSAAYSQGYKDGRNVSLNFNKKLR